MSRVLDEFIRQKRRWLRFDQRDIEMAANDLILAADGNMRRDDAKRYARAMFESKGMEFTP